MGFDLKDCFLFGGLAIAAGGISFLSWPIALTVFGAILFLIGVYLYTGGRS